MPRSTYYQQPLPESAENLRLLRQLDQLYLKRPFYGSRKLAVELEVNRKRIQRLMRILGIEAHYPKPNLSRPQPGHQIYPYLLRGVEILRPNHVWSTDITYIPMLVHGHITGTFPALTGSYKHTVVDAALCPDFPVDTAHLHKSEICGSSAFATIAEDRAHHYYVMFASQRLTDENFGGSPTLIPSGPNEIYIAASKDGVHWRKPVRVSTTGSNAFPWITAGSDGRVAATWYSTSETHEKPAIDAIGGQLNSPDPHGYTFDNLKHAEFDIKVGVSLNAMSAHPRYSVATVSEHPIKYGPICTGGLGCSVTMGDRSLGDFMQVNYDKRGALVFSYVDDTSGYFSVGPTGAVADSGPPVVVRQVAGPSLLHGTIHGPRTVPPDRSAAVADPSGDAVFYANSLSTNAGPTST